jgi:hypothetical protein
MQLPIGDIESALARLVAEGVVLGGRFSAPRRTNGASALLARIHRYTVTGCARRSSRWQAGTSCASCFAGSI